MDRKAVFIDVDGTLVNDRGVVPGSARRAVSEARANGHLMFLSTGRSMAEIWPEIREIGFDGYIAGAYVEAGDEVLVHHHLSQAVLAELQKGLGGFIDAIRVVEDGIWTAFVRHGLVEPSPPGTS
jgi:HAD superfamily hydrolase (TIGR01484 family)